MLRKHWITLGTFHTVHGSIFYRVVVCSPALFDGFHSQGAENECQNRPMFISSHSHAKGWSNHRRHGWIEKESNMKLTFTAEAKPKCEATVSRHIYSHVKYIFFFFYWDGFFGDFVEQHSSLSHWIVWGGHICLLPLPRLSVRSQVFVWMKT